MKKYYLRLEIRYDAIGEDDERNYHTNTANSDTFDNEKDCIDYGNKLITDNLWIEQYPGYVGDRLNKKFGRPLVAPSLKNGAQIFISVESLNILDLDVELKKFNVNKITGKL